MALVGRTFQNPLTDGVFLLVGEFLMGAGRRHEARAIGLKNPVDDQGLFRVTWDNRRLARTVWFGGFLAKVQTEPGHPGGFIGAMAAEASVGHNGANIPVEANRSLGQGANTESE